MRVNLLFPLCLLGLLAIAAGAQAQTPFPEIQVPQTPAVSSPLPPSAGTGEASPEIPLPGIGTQAYSGDPNADPATSVILENADTFEQTGGGQWIGRGNVRVRYKGYLLTSDEVDADLDRGEVTFLGHVVLKSPDGETVNGGPTGVLKLNLRRNTYTLTGARTTVQPEVLQVGVILPLFVYGGVITGRPGLIDARNAEFTTCDFLNPHYAFGARQVYILPGKRLVARNVSFLRKGKRLFSLPYLVVPLDRRFARQTIFPQVGQTPDEGYFIKFAFGYALAASLPGILRLDEMQKKGTGTGFEQNYGSLDNPRRGAGVVSFYNLYDKSRGVEDLTGNLSHRQQFGTVAATLTGQFQQNSYYQGESTSRGLSSQLGLTRNVGNLSTSLQTNLTENSYGLGTSNTLNSAFDQTFQPTNRERFETRFNYSQFDSPSLFGTGGSSRRELDSNLDYAQRGQVVDLEILGQKYSQLGSSNAGSTFYGGVERLPEVRLATDALRLTGLQAFLPKTTRMDLSLGDFREPTSSTSTERARFNLDLGTILKKLNARNTLEFGGSFQQGFYGDNTAQYVLNGRSAYRLRIGGKSSADVSYTYLRPYGFTPFQFDFAGNTNQAAFNFFYQETRPLKLSIGTGYDFNQNRSRNGFSATPWQNLTAQALYSPNDAVRLRTTTSYDLNHNTLLDLTNSLRVRSASGLALDIGARFSPLQHKFSNINGQLDFPFLRDPSEDAGYRLRAIGGYNGFTSRFEYQGLALTRSWHDYEATLIYQDTPQGLRPGSSITLNFRLKAFPASEPFAVGQFGQSLDPGLGEVY